MFENTSKLHNRLVSAVQIEVNSHLTEAGHDLTFKQSIQNPRRTSVKILTIYNVKDEQGKVRLERIKSTTIKFDKRANIESKAETVWHSSSPNTFTGDKSIEARGDDGELLDITHDQTIKRELSYSFDPEAVIASLLIDDDKATVAFLTKYLPPEFGLAD